MPAKSLRWLVAAGIAIYFCIAYADAEPTAPTVATFEYQDHRPALETGMLADDCINPAPPEYFKQWLMETYPDQLPGSKVVLKQLVIKKVEAPVQINTERRDPAIGVLGSLMVSALDAGFTNLRGRYVVTVELSGTIDSEEFSSSAQGIFRGNVTEPEIKAVIDAAAAKTYSIFKARFFVRDAIEQAAQ